MGPGITWESPQCGVVGQGDMAKVENGSRLLIAAGAKRGKKVYFTLRAGPVMFGVRLSILSLASAHPSLSTTTFWGPR